MNRLHGEHTCNFCGKVPSLGWVYSCQQDRLLQYKHFAPSTEALPTVSDSGDFFEAQAKVAETLGMSKSIIKQMREGEYSFDQTETLLQQRRHVLEVIKRAEDLSAHSTPSHSTSPSKFQLPAENVIASVGAVPAVQHTSTSALPMSPAGTPANTPTESTTTTPTKHKKTKKLTCNFQVCHACRPFFQDRLYMSFEPMLNNKMPVVTEEEITTLPILDPKTVRNLGLRETAKPKLPAIQTQNGLNTAMHQADGYTDDSSDWTPTSTTNSYSESDLMLDEGDPFPCPGPGICPLASPIKGCAYDNGFDDGNRALNHGFTLDQGFDRAMYQDSYSRVRRMRGSDSTTPGGTSSTCSSISLPEPKSEPLTPITPPFGRSNRFEKMGKAATVTGAMASGSDPIDVDGGVALTEEAVESRMPDITITT
ncbi:hypothetical protein LTR37_011592 [Vermiconidia calcicola]|uniref:Uncharacterized protein n=1 Tax=Vermiconidia calcicola TaxID=1690605 RepID=A0ACC3N1W9_9PEZI|nr:hypothetical protein LTR37_011592 [Vermiconidia calcicola]